MVIDELILKEDGIDKNVDSADNKTIDLIHFDSGKNLLDVNDVRTFDINNVTRYGFVLPKGLSTITISAKLKEGYNESSSAMYVANINNGYSSVGVFAPANTKQKTVALNSENEYAFICGSTSSQVIFQALIDSYYWQIEESEEASFYEPFGGRDYHFAKESQVAGIDKVTCYDAVDEPIIDMQISGNSVQDAGNLFDASTMSERIYAYISGGDWYPASDSYSIRVPVKQNSTYTISMQNEVTIFRAGCAETEDVPVTNVKVDLFNVVTQTNNTPITITTTANTKYLVIQSTAATMEETLKTLAVYQDVPTPDAPIMVESVGDRTHNLLNLYDVEDVNQYVNANNGTVVAPSSTGGIWRASGFIRIDGGKTYHLNAINNDAWTAGMAWYDATKTYISGIPTGTTNLTGGVMTSPENAFYMRVSWRIEEGYNPDWENTVQVSEGDTAKEFEPYGYKVPVKTTLNLFDISRLSYENGFIYNDSGVKTTSDASGHTTMKIAVQPNTKYYRLGTIGHSWYVTKIYCYDINKNWISRLHIEAGVNDTTFITPAGCYFIDLQYVMETVDWNTIRIQPEIPATNIYLKEPLRKIGDHTDYIDYKNKKIVRNIGAKQYISTTGFAFYKNGEGTSQWFIQAGTVISDAKSDVTTGNALCNYFENKIIYLNTTEAGFQLRWGAPTFRTANEITIEEFSAFLEEKNNEGNPLTIYYQLATPTEESVEMPEIYTYDGTNYFAVETIIEPTAMSVNYWEQITPQEVEEIIQEGGNILIISTGAEITQEGTNLIIGG